MTCYCQAVSWCLQQSLLLPVLVSPLGTILGLSNEGGYRLGYPKATWEFSQFRDVMTAVARSVVLPADSRSPL